MKTVLLLLSFLITLTSKSQNIDSTWLTTNYLPRFYKDTGTYLPDSRFVDTNNRERVLTDYKGKILYVDIWATWCGPCLAELPHQVQLLKRLKATHLDSLIQLISININDTKQEWQTALKKYQPVGINLYCSDTALLTKWNIEAPPSYIILDSSGKVLGKDVSRPSEAGTIDYVLYSATKDIHPVQALWKKLEQDKLMEKYKTSNAFTDKDYKNWFDMTIQSFVEYQKWQQLQQQNSR
jgi:thiol-disulfide isomerase/thioredoxin